MEAFNHVEDDRVGHRLRDWHAPVLVGHRSTRVVERGLHDSDDCLVNVFGVGFGI